MVLFILAAIKLTLYAKYKQGDIISGKQLMAEQLTAYQTPIPKHLRIEGFQSVKIIPSDTFYFEAGKNGNRLQEKPYSWHDDTLQIRGDLTITRNFMGYLDNQSGSWQIIVYCPVIEDIQLRNVDADITQNHHSGITHYNFSLDNARLSVGSNDPDNSAPTGEFAGIRLHSIQSIITLAENAYIDTLSIWLDKKSSTRDNGAAVNTLMITCPEKASINLTAANIKKLKLITE